MLFVFDALKLSSKKVFLSILNIIVFRFIYDLISQWIMTGTGGLFLTIYVTNQVRGIMNNFYKSFKRSYYLKKNKPYEEFDKKNLSSFETKLSGSTIKELDLDKKCQKDLFSYIFNAGSNSSLINLVTIIGIEYIHNKYELSTPISILYCVSIAFVVIFGSSLRYSSVISKESLEFFETKNDLVDLINIYYTDSLENKELVCIWKSILDPKTTKRRLEIKFLSIKYATNLSDIIEYFSKNHMKLSSSETSIEGDTQEVEYYSVVIPDYYDIGLVFSNKIKSLGFKKLSSWTEFIMFPTLHLKLSTYANLSKQEEKNKKIN